MTAIDSTWRNLLDERQRKEIAFAELYVAHFGHGTTGHNQLILIARLAQLLDVAAGVAELPAPPEGGELVLTLGKYRDRALGEVYVTDRGYVEWLAREGRDLEVRQAAQALLAGPVLSLPPVEAAPGEEGELPF